MQAYEEGEDFLSLASTLGIKRTTAYSIVTRFVKEGRTESIEHRGGRRCIIDDETIDFLVLLLEANPDLTLREMKDTVREIWSGKPHFSEVTLSRALDGEAITLKMSRDCPAERNSEPVLDSRREYAQWLICRMASVDTVYMWMKLDTTSGRNAPTEDRGWESG